jgi:hypothetical protein
MLNMCVEFKMRTRFCPSLTSTTPLQTPPSWEKTDIFTLDLQNGRPEFRPSPKKLPEIRSKPKGTRRMSDYKKSNAEQNGIVPSSTVARKIIRTGLFYIFLSQSSVSWGISLVILKVEEVLDQMQLLTLLSHRNM